MRFKLLCVGKLKTKTPEYELIQRYKTRFKTPFDIEEIEIKNIQNPHDLNKKENLALINHISIDDYNVAMDKDGKAYSSEDLSQFINHQKLTNVKRINFIIGGADGLNDDVRKMCQTKISFGKQTWPHMLIRVMLFEQIYRAQCITDGHPYHK